MTPFLEAIWPTNPALFGEIRAIKAGQVTQFFVPLDGLGPAEAWVIAQGMNDREMDTYFGVLPRVRKSGTANDCVDETTLLWADVDAKHFTTDLKEGKRIALEKVGALMHTPQVLVDSGGGTHAYWLLAEPIPYERGRSIMRDIARLVGGDAVHDKPRVLRVPGTFNWKREPEVYARVLRMDLDALRFRPSDFDVYAETKRDWPERTTTRERVDDLPEWLTDLIVQGAPQGQRSEATFKAVLYLLKYGRTEEEVRNFIRNTPDGIGNKVAEMEYQAGERWIARTIAAALARIDD
jgi:hypothetical protein